MHVGIAYLLWRRKRSRHSRRMCIRDFAYLIRGPWKIFLIAVGDTSRRLRKIATLLQRQCSNYDVQAKHGKMLYHAKASIDLNIAGINWFIAKWHSAPNTGVQKLCNVCFSYNTVDSDIRYKCVYEMNTRLGLHINRTIGDPWTSVFL